MTTPTPTATITPITVAPITVESPPFTFKPSLEGRYDVSIEEAVVYGTGETKGGGRMELLLDLVLPDTGTDGPRPLLVHIHGGSFVTGSRNPQWDAAERGWVAASIDYRLAGDEPLPGQRVEEFFNAIGGGSSSARDRSFVASVEDTLVALDYLLNRADELNIDTNRIVLKGESAGAFIALTIAYCADKFEPGGPAIAAVIDFAGGISEIFCGGATAIDPGEAAVFIAHGTEDTTVSFTNRALSIVDGATAAEIPYEFHPLEGEGHEWLGSDIRLRMESLMYEFLDRVLY
jgi:predicted esterase